MNLPCRTLEFTDRRLPGAEEWLVTNGLGGYASGLVAGGLARRFHGLLIASLPAPVGRWLCLSHLGLAIAHGGRTFVIDGLAPRRLQHPDAARLVEFTLEGGLPIWRYEAGHMLLEKRVVMAYDENTTHVLFRLIQGGGQPILTLRPGLDVRPHEGRVAHAGVPPERFDVDGRLVEMDVTGLGNPIRWLIEGEGAALNLGTPEDLAVRYDLEEERGYDHAGRLWSPGTIEVPLGEGTNVALTISTESWDTIRARTADDAVAREQTRRRLLLETAGDPDDPFVAELTLAADQFLISPVGRAEEIARARAVGDEPRSVIAGYHWFTDWGRDTMISLEGLTLATGRAREGGCILRTFAHYVRDGLIPNMFPEGERSGLYHTADATLWFFHALHRYVALTGDRATLTQLLPTLVSIAEHHVQGTHFGIGVDERDGLLSQGAEGYQLTWMDAKVDGWVVTPRRGKAVEINALWHNAVCLLARWLVESNRAGEAERWTAAAGRAAQAFNERFWNPDTGYLFDVVDGEEGNDPACRPNQLLAISLDYPVLHHTRWKPVLDIVAERLLTPIGLRTLAADHPSYQRAYQGNLLARDAAYHQGTVWAWLMGPFVDAWLRVHPDDKTTARSLLAAFPAVASTFGVGSLAEIFDAEAPHRPRGCIAQAWSVAEVLRAWRTTRL